MSIKRERRDLKTVISETGGILALPFQRHAGKNLVAQGNPHSKLRRSGRYRSSNWSGSIAQSHWS